jgi:hypothetical protein
VGGIWEARPVDQNDANDVQRKAQRYDLIEAALLDGDIFSALEQLNGKMSSKSVTRLVDNFLPSLLALSRDLYRRATRPVFGNWLGTVYSEADAMGDKGLMDAASSLATHVFQSDEQRQAAERYRIFDREVMEYAYKGLETIVFDGIEDPGRQLTPFTRRAIAYVALAELDRRLEEDPELTGALEALWERAREGGFMIEHREALVRAHLSRARDLVPGILRCVVAEALGHQDRPATASQPATWNLRRDADFLNATKH